MMKKNAYIQNLSEVCSECKICCHDGVPEGICGFNTIDAILKEQIPTEKVEKLIIYRVKNTDITDAALRWWHLPEENILEMITGEENGYYEFLAIPFEENNCVFLGEEGCEYTFAKPFDCSMFPFYYENGNFKMVEWCDLTKLDKEVEFFKQNTASATIDYIEYSKSHKKEYLKFLKLIKEKFTLKTLEYSKETS